MIAQYLMGAVVSTAIGEGVDMQRRHRRAGRALEKFPFLALPSTVAGAYGHTLAGGRAQRWPVEGTREAGKNPEANCAYHDIVRRLLRPSTTSDRRVSGFPTEHS